ncbi:MAG: hypothetical protein AAGF83_09655 [Cyanobacteria bacterium P01_G01_bin.67]
MNKKLLTILGCSGSVAVSLLNTNAVSAKEYIFTAPELDSQLAEIPERETDYPLIDCSCDEYDAETAAELDREGDKAIQLYGCDCAGCRNLVRNVVEEQPQS